MDTTEGREGGSGRGNGERWRRWHSAVRERARERRGEDPGESERVRAAWQRSGHPDEEGRGQAGREGGGGRARGRGRLWRGHAAAWARGRKTTEEEARWAGLANWAGQAAQERAAQGGKRQVSLFSLLFFFSIF